MATLTIKNLPASVYERLKDLAAENRRSMNSEAILAVEKAVAAFGAPDAKEILASLRQARARLGKVYVRDAALSAARASGRE